MRCGHSYTRKSSHPYPRQHCKRYVRETDGRYDRMLTWKLCGDRCGLQRHSQAAAVFHDAACGSAPTTQLYNALMSVCLTSGFTAARSVAELLYDRMGQDHVAPNIETYRMVILSLAMQANMEEAEAVFAFLRSHAADRINIDVYNALLAGYRQEKRFDDCDLLWRELMDRKWPRPNVETAEIYLSSVLDLAYTPMSKNMTIAGEPNQVEKKRIPIILNEMESMGIPRAELNPLLRNEVEDALRKFQIYKSRFYEWGRAVKLFDFVEFRRRLGWLYDVREMTPTVHAMPPPSRDCRPAAGLRPCWHRGNAGKILRDGLGDARDRLFVDGVSNKRVHARHKIRRQILRRATACA